MPDPVQSRIIGALSFAESGRNLRTDSILCLPLGSIEQHGPHLPLNTDLVIAEEITRRIVARWGSEFDLWQLPAFPIGLSREHEWASGTQSLSIAAFTAVMRDIGQAIVRSTSAHNLLVVNGHGGNRGILQNLVYEWEGDFGLNVVVLHPLALSKVKTDPRDIHAGLDETSLMLEFAPQLVRMDRVAAPSGHVDPNAIDAMILDPGATFAWSSGDPRLADKGVTGDPRKANAELGRRIADSIVEETRAVLLRLREKDGATLR